MNLYLVFMPGGGEKVQATFPDRNYEFTKSLWAVAGKEATCADVCSALGIARGSRGIVSTVSEYYGHFDRALWQKLSAWSSEA